ncbi:TetR/AcrR family transcriptional regulator [Acerihabitans sp. KWT182]|uniref:TetR/AcrR family transcriptional regulator n=1 Tax=Acerihabitans sp. KWT182 TaxID=3157919 RepID=A0AAU7QFC5_9GAMM
MGRLSRSESQAKTREQLLASAQALFRQEGYAATSVERIAEAAGYSKGAVYSNFDNKEAIFLEVLERQGRQSLSTLLDDIARAAGAAEAVNLLVCWADVQSRSGSWALVILEHARAAMADTASVRRQEEIIRANWRQLGNVLRRRFPHLTQEGETLGALLHEIAYAPAVTFISRPTAGELMRVAAESLLLHETA